MQTLCDVCMDSRLPSDCCCMLARLTHSALQCINIYYLNYLLSLFPSSYFSPGLSRFKAQRWVQFLQMNAKLTSKQASRKLTQMWVNPPKASKNEFSQHHNHAPKKKKKICVTISKNLTPFHTLLLKHCTPVVMICANAIPTEHIWWYFRPRSA